VLFESNRSNADSPKPDGSLDLVAFYTRRMHLEVHTPRCSHPQLAARTVPPAYRDRRARIMEPAVLRLRQAPDGGGLVASWWSSRAATVGGA